MVVDKKRILIIGLCIMALVLFFVVLFFRFYQFYTIIGNSMSPSLRNERTYLMERGPLQPNRGDIIVFYHEPEQLTYVKRVIAMEGETIRIHSGKVFIDGEELDEPYQTKTGKTDDFGPYQVPKGHVFVLGDHRVDSVDSRQFGAVPTQDIRGKIVSYE
ncbi:signal peptidase I [Salinithrix halophila]|uniref:Signal peptidase I n=1 Tax=Salinithrix halophila TaxID=1485204 RepID=A0ABV8JGD7_9BACL